MQNWIKKGLIYDPAKSALMLKGAVGFSAVPFVYPLSEEKGIYRIFFSARDGHNRSLPFFIDYDFENNRILKESGQLLPLGEPGAFDDSGIMLTSIMEKEDVVYLFYIGWNLGVTVPFRNSIGLAVSSDKGETFTRMFKGPIIDRNRTEPHFVASNCVLEKDGRYIMYYLSCTGWENIEGKMMHRYHIKWAVSSDLVNWERNNNIAIDFKYPNEYAISVPRVMEVNGKFMMWYSYRGGPYSEKYRIGYAESDDAFNWERKDELVNLDVSENGWDSDMVCYPCVFEYKGQLMMLYNGNDYGRTGIGLAVLGN
jgi:sucrose-6-phosphate hydrolase SacC (GH32 family)